MKWIQGDKQKEVKIVNTSQRERGKEGILQHHYDQQRDLASPHKLETCQGSQGRRLRSTLHGDHCDCDAGPSPPTEGAALNSTQTSAQSRQGVGAWRPRWVKTKVPYEAADKYTTERITVGRAEFMSPSPPLFMVRRKVERQRNWQNK